MPLTVKELRELIADMPGEATVEIPLRVFT